MLYLALVALNVVTGLLAFRFVNRQARQHAREREMLLARVCHLAERPLATDIPWEPDVANETPAPFLIPNPEQWVA